MLINIEKYLRLDGFSFHPKSKDEELMVQVKKAIDRIKKNEAIMMLYAHDIRPVNEKGSHFITPEALEEILAYVVSKQVKMFAFDELS